MVNKEQLQEIQKVFVQRMSFSFYQDRSFNLCEKTLKKMATLQDFLDVLYNLLNSFSSSEDISPRYSGFIPGYEKIDNIENIGYFRFEQLPINNDYDTEILKIIKDYFSKINFIELNPDLFRIYKVGRIDKEYYGQGDFDTFAYPSLQQIEEEEEEDNDDKEEQEVKHPYLEENQFPGGFDDVYPKKSISIIVEYQPNRKQPVYDEDGEHKTDENGQQLYEDMGDFIVSIYVSTSVCEYVYVINAYPYTLQGVKALFVPQYGVHDNTELLESQIEGFSVGIMKEDKDIKKLTAPSLFSQLLEKEYQKNFKANIEAYYGKKFDKITSEEKEKFLKIYKPMFRLENFEDITDEKKSVFDISRFDTSSMFGKLKQCKGLIKQAKVYQWNLPGAISQTTGNKVNHTYGTKIKINNTMNESIPNINELFEGTFFKPEKYGYKCAYSISLESLCNHSEFYGSIQKWKNEFE